MKTKAEIQAKYLAEHDTLGTRKDAADKELFDQQHRQIWIDCDIELEARFVELAIKPTLSKAETLELSELEVLFPKPSPPPVDLVAKLDAALARIAELERRL